MGSCPILLTLMNFFQKLEELLGIDTFGKNIIDVTKFEKLHKSQVFAILDFKF